MKNLRKLYESCDPSQIEVKYGGKRPNITEYWPPSPPPAVFNKKDLVSEKEYKRMYLK